MRDLFLLFLLIIPFWACSTKAERNTPSQNETSIKDNINTAYASFTHGYQTLDEAMVGSSYTKDALLINVYQDADPRSYQGRESIQRFFAETFAPAKRDELDLKITFKISDRQILEKTILDNGYYKLEIGGPNQTTSERYGKFSIVLQQEFGEWKFGVDTNASATLKEYEGAQSI